MGNTVTFTALLKDLFSSPLSKLETKSNSAFSKIGNNIDSVNSHSKGAISSLKQIDEQLDKLKETRYLSVDTKQIKAANKEIAALELQQAKLTASGSTNIFGKGISSIGKYVGAYVTAQAAINLGKGIFEETAKKQKLQAVLGNILEDQDKANYTIEKIEDLATKSPFKIDEWTDAYVRLANLGITPTLEDMQSLGDVASSAGKDYDALLEAIGNASMGNYKALRQFGIKAKIEGDKIEMTFRGVTTEVENNQDAIENYVVSIGKMDGVSGSMEKVANTLGGSITTLTNNWDQLLETLGKSGTGFSTAIGWANKLIVKLTEFSKSSSDYIPEETGVIDSKVQVYIDAFKNAGVSKETTMKDVKAMLQREYEGKDINGNLATESFDVDNSATELKKLKARQQKLLSLLSSDSKFEKYFDNLYTPPVTEPEKPDTSGLGSGVDNVSGNASVKNIYITVTKMVGVETLSTSTLNASESEIGAAMDKVLLTTLNDANRMEGNE